MKKLFQFLIPILIVSTIAYAIDRTYKAPSGDLILDADGDVVVNKKLGVGTSAPSWQIQSHADPATNNLMQISNANTGDGISDGFTFGVLTSGEVALIQREGLPLGLWTTEIKRVEIEADGDVVVNENLGIGRTPTSELDVYTSSGASYIFVDSQSGNSGVWYNQAGSFVWKGIQSGGTDFNFIDASDNPVLTLHQDDDVTVQDGDLNIAAAGKGVVFTNGGGSTLSHYETGTFNPVWSGYASSPTVTAYYTRIGNIGTVRISAFEATSTTNSLSFNNLPTSMRPTSDVTLNVGTHKDAGTSASGGVAHVTSSGIVSFYTSGAYASWTIGGAKGFSYAVSFSYLID